MHLAAARFSLSRVESSRVGSLARATKRMDALFVNSFQDTPVVPCLSRWGYIIINQPQQWHLVIRFHWLCPAMPCLELVGIVVDKKFYLQSDRAETGKETGNSEGCQQTRTHWKRVAQCVIGIHLAFLCCFLLLSSFSPYC